MEFPCILNTSLEQWPPTRHMLSGFNLHYMPKGLWSPDHHTYGSLLEIYNKTMGIIMGSSFSECIWEWELPNCVGRWPSRTGAVLPCSSSFGLSVLNIFTTNVGTKQLRKIHVRVPSQQTKGGREKLPSWKKKPQEKQDPSYWKN